MPITQFEQGVINQVAGKHDQMRQDVESQLKTLQQNVNQTLESSGSRMTTALEQTYGQWFQGMNQMVLTKTQDLTTAMNKVAEEQEAQDEAGSSAVAASPVTGFLGG